MAANVVVLRLTARFEGPLRSQRKRGVKGRKEGEMKRKERHGRDGTKNTPSPRTKFLVTEWSHYITIQIYRRTICRRYAPSFEMSQPLNFAAYYKQLVVLDLLAMT